MSLFRSPRKTAGRRSGFALVEVMVSAMILTVCGFMMSATITATMTHRVVRQETAAAADVARNVLEEMRSARAAVSQGITTIVVGQDGGSDYPLADFFTRAAASPPAVNVASYTGHASLRRRVMGEDLLRAATPAEVDSMAALLRVDMEAGSLGLSTGLEYSAGFNSKTEEVVALARVAVTVTVVMVSMMVVLVMVSDVHMTMSGKSVTIGVRPLRDACVTHSSLMSVSMSMRVLNMQVCSFIRCVCVWVCVS